jgi:hypothetical protein
MLPFKVIGNVWFFMDPNTASFYNTLVDSFFYKEFLICYLLAFCFLSNIAYLVGYKVCYFLFLTKSFHLCFIREPNAIKVARSVRERKGIISTFYFILNVLELVLVMFWKWFLGMDVKLVK